jgi:hypothetical protein
MKFPTITTDAQVTALPPFVRDAARPKVKSYKRFCGGGLYVVVSSTAKSLRAGFKIRGESQTHTFGPHPEISLANAREQLERLRADLENGLDPRERIYAKRDAKGHRFEAAAHSWLATHLCTARHKALILRNFENYVFPVIGKRLLDDVDTYTVAQICKRIAARPAPVVAAQVRTWISAVYVWAKNDGLTKENPASDVKLPPRNQRHFGRVGEEDLPRFLVDLANSRATRVVELGLRLMVHTCPRTKTQRLIEWAHVDFKNKMIRVPDRNMKNSKAAHGPKGGDFLIPMSKEVVAIMTELQTLTGAGRWVFPHRKRPWEPVTNAAWLMALKRMGWDGTAEKTDSDYKPNITVHGFRSTFMTICKQRWAHQEIERRAIDRQLDHVDSDAVNAAYERDEDGGHRGLYLPERKKLMARWSAYLVTLETKAAAKQGGARSRASNKTRREAIAHAQ